MIGNFVLVRTVNAGVHCGYLKEVSQVGQSVMLTDARRVWRWSGANTLHELSLRGADMEYTRISEPVEEICILDAIELIPCTESARNNLSQSRWSE